jgi:hypothetical protein
VHGLAEDELFTAVVEWWSTRDDHCRVSKSKWLLVAGVLAFFVVVVVGVAMCESSEPEVTRTAPVAVAVDAGADAVVTGEVAPIANDEMARTVAPNPARMIPSGRGRLHIDVVDRAGNRVSGASLLIVGGLGPAGAPPTKPAPDDVVRIVDDGHDTERGVDVDLSPGRADVSAYAHGFRPKRADGNVRAAQVAVLRVVMDPSNAIHGTVRDRGTRAPIAGASVTGVASDVDDVTTDANGHFDLDRLPDAHLTLAISAAGYRRMTIGGIRGDRSRDEIVDVELEPLSDGGPVEEYVGVGFNMDGHDHGQKPYVADVYAGSPASEVLHVGDDILDIDGVDVSNAGVGYARSLMLGDVDSAVRLGVMRDGQRLQFDITRARLPVIERKKPSAH